MREFPSIDILIPTLNEEKNLVNCLEAIVRQQYPKEKIRITVIDGGSRDSTLKIAEKYGCNVLFNKEMLAEPGVAYGIHQSGCDLCCILAVDNIIVNDNDFFLNISLPFIEQEIVGAFPGVISSPSEPLINQYINFSAEPFSEFIYGKSCNSNFFHNVYPLKYVTNKYTIFNYISKDFPLLALAQGFTIDTKKFLKLALDGGDDIQVIANLIKSGGDIAFVKTAIIHHYQIMNLRMFIKKIQWRIMNNLKSNRTSGIKLKKHYTIKKYLWVLYSATIILPLIYSIYQIVKTSKSFYIYHFITNTLLLLLIPITFIQYSTGNLNKTYR
jgi:glycosyltransferase involved in cell wall biosynthesis